MFKIIVNYLIGWLHWLIYGDWSVGILTDEECEDEVEEKVYSKDFDDSVVAQPFIQSGSSQK